ncbi:MAG: tRNA (adenosine(37)-N6)-threonylcarbamoyltransferase complex dimerization subunit type 1 TsaB [Candidatus Omnitrophica bacterium]|nr:tRNA (adenosine(37)-N6)-threonylcarbamoyltransferase complex dimerization subunit type 1 TsaB [Candidatus Omnitrophota bacterium]MCM8770584.1 tRNA (adenosine(37)-N6)-threonylcarbamoyltransferase complex dimerization subunit type 1 TsaB [Candidatus Omnitrophota bacterium]
MTELSLNMNILAIDTTTQFLCLGILKQGKIFQLNEDLGRRHAELLIPHLRYLLKKARVSLDDIDYFACDIGPGSFTGIRIGLSAVKGLAYSFKKPVVGISSLDILAHNVDGYSEGLVIPLIDAKRGLVYSAIYKIKKDKIIKTSPYMLVSPLTLFKKVKTKQRVYFLGDGIKNFYDLIIAKMGKDAKILNEDYWYPTAAKILKIAQGLIKKKRSTDALKIKPLYLYPKECQISKTYDPTPRL